MQTVLFSAYSQTVNLTIQEKERPLKEVLEKIEKNTKLVFFYNDKDVDLKRKVTVDRKDQPISVILTDLFKNTQNTFKIDGNQVYIIKKSTSEQTSQTLPVVEKQLLTGKIIDEDGLPIAGATIQEFGTTNGTTTDINGNYSIRVTPNATLEIIYLGYQ
ncbi:MAG: carboxypeptidase-like regulatory domain-containing protein, partial [Dysgonamonadaceae bacterium]|nr:carboxypeptidase-like regulatory domain-containing protein [Dysgonamonadaceae bacterium]